MLLVHTSYGYLMGLPFSAFGEAAILFIQNLLLVALIYKYSSAAASRVMLTSSIAAGCLGVVATGELDCRSTLSYRQQPFWVVFPCLIVLCACGRSCLNSMEPCF